MVDITNIYVTLITIIGLSCSLSVNQITVTKFVAKRSWFIILLFCIWMLKLKRNVFFLCIFVMITAIFKSLLYEACGRIVNPIYGSTGLLWSGSWQLCQAAVEAVLNGLPITQVSSESAFKACDIRHVSKEEMQRPSDQLHKVKSRRSRFKKSSAAAKLKPKVESLSDELAGDTWNVKKMSHDDELGTSENPSWGGGAEAETDCVSAETVEASLAKSDGSDVELDLDLSLGLGNWDRDTCKVDVAFIAHA